MHDNFGDLIETGDDLRAWMIEMGRLQGRGELSIHEVSRLMGGYSRKSLSMILAGKTLMPRCRALAAWALMRRRRDLILADKIGPSASLDEGVLYAIRRADPAEQRSARGGIDARW